MELDVQNFRGIRTFWAVMITFAKAALICSQAWGPVQLGFSRRVEPVFIKEVTITRIAITTVGEAENKGAETGLQNPWILPNGSNALLGKPF